MPAMLVVWPVTLPGERCRSDHGRSACAENTVTLFGLADKEHPASKAGRYVRAAGIVLGKEIDRRAAAADAKAAAPPPPPPPPPPPAVETHTFVGRWIFRFFV